jgi:uroporphyrinogen III methyltransferase/synthase
MTPSPQTVSPLHNRSILVACSAKKMVELVAGLTAMGGSVLAVPVIEIREIEDKFLMDQAIVSVGKYAWIIFTSAYGVDFFMQRLADRNPEALVRGLPKICAIGPATAAALEVFGCKATLVPDRYVAEGVVEALGEYHGGIRNLSGLRVLLPRAKEARVLLPEALSDAGARIDVVPCYETVQAEPDPKVLQQLNEKEPDLIVFTSSSTVTKLVNILGPDIGRKMLQASKVAVLGPITASTAAAYGKTAEILPKENTVSSLLEAIRHYFGIH